MSYIEDYIGWAEDALIGGTDTPVRLYNASLSSGASVERGELLCADSLGVYSPVASTDDSVKPLAIAAHDLTADSIQAVTQIYVSGTFNKDKIKMPEGVDIKAFSTPLRFQEIYLTRGE